MLTNKNKNNSKPIIDLRNLDCIALSCQAGDIKSQCKCDFNLYTKMM